MARFRFVAVAAVLVACGGDGGHGPGPTTRPDGSIELLPAEVAPVRAGGLPAGSAWDATSRPEQDLSGTWRFRFDDADAGVAEGWFRPEHDRSKWSAAPVPGTWDPSPKGDDARSTVGWYALEFTAADLGHWPRLRLDGVFRASEAWLNGTRIGGDDVPYLPAWYDVSAALVPAGRNLLVVRVDSRLTRDSLPCDTVHAPGRHGWWPYGGITRPVVLEGGPAVAVQRARVTATLGGGGEGGTVEARLDVVRKPGATGAARLDVRVLAPGGGTALAVGAADLPKDWSGTARVTGVVASPIAWDRTDSAGTAYRIEATVTDPAGGATAIATVAADFAFRTFEARGGRLLLNGADVFLHGVNRHEDHPVHGPVFDGGAMAQDVGLMREMGVDFCRTAHYPNDVRTVRALEAAGILLAEEIPVYQLAAPQLADPVLLDRSVRAIRRLVARDSTRPGVVMWSVANEVWTFAPEAEGFVRALADAARAEDPSRPVMQAVVNEPLASFSEIDTGVAPVDVVGVNEYWGWYQGTSDQLGAYLDKAHARWPDKTFFLSEYGGDALRGRRSHRPPAEEDPFDHSYTEDFQVRLHRLHLRQAADREWLRGVMPWVWADFRMEWKPSTGRPHPRPGWNLKGLVDGRRKPKESFFLYKAAYSKEDGLAVPADPACGNGEVEIGEACDGGAVRPCADLGAAWASGDASCRADCAGYDTSGCLPAGPPGRYEVVKPAERDPARFADARCNDGSPFAFRVWPSPTGSRDWSISLRGGGFCDDAAVPCLRTPDLMSSVKLPDRTLFVPDDGETGGVLDRSQTANPDLFDANHVFAWYCSSDFWAGTATEARAFENNPDTAWYFSGRLNVAAMIDTLAERYGLSDDPETRVLFSGTSSGAFGVAGNADLLADLLPDAAAGGRVRLLIDAGWLVHDWDEPDMRVMLAATPDADVMRRAWSEFRYRFSPRCERAMLDLGGHPGDCVFGYRFLPALAAPPPRGLGLPVMLQQSLMDHTFAAYHNKPDDPEAAARYGERQLADVLAVDPDPGASDGLAAWWFLGWSFYHDVIRSTGEWALGEPGSTLPEAISRFWSGAPPQRVIWDPRRR